MKKTIKILCLLTMLSTLLVACKKAEDKPKESASPSPTSEVSESPSDATETETAPPTDDSSNSGVELDEPFAFTNMAEYVDTMNADEASKQAMTSMLGDLGTMEILADGTDTMVMKSTLAAEVDEAAIEALKQGLEDPTLTEYFNGLVKSLVPAVKEAPIKIRVEYYDKDNKELFTKEFTSETES